MSERSVVLIGFMGCGKSVVGREVSRRLQCRHLDSDREIESQFGKSVPAIFADHGEAAFRRAETEWLQQYVRGHEPAGEGNDVQRVVLSTGGGTPLREENAAVLPKIGAVVYLHASPRTILERVRAHIDQRPLLASHSGNPLSRIRSLLDEREPYYSAVADLQVESYLSRRPGDVAAEIIERLGLK
jgi:shikimate kinase